ncbi:hypothetical protein BDW75DRAFT_235296 [Aspergillus navahoensis]
MTETLSSFKPALSFCSSQSHHSRHSDNVLARKRERDKENQHRKRECEHEYIAGLESKIKDLEQKLGDANLARLSPNYQFLRRGEMFAPLLAHLRAEPGMEAACPPYPKVLDLFFGGSSNLLANFVHSEISGLPLLLPEKFASMYLVYLYLRWLVWPSEDNFSQFPEQYCPTILQLHVLGLFCCMFRIQGCSGSDFITCTNDGEPQAKDDFIQQIMDLSYWYLLEEFWIKYPELVENLDPGLMLQRDSLIL